MDVRKGGGGALPSIRVLQSRSDRWLYGNEATQLHGCFTLKDRMMFLCFCFYCVIVRDPLRAASRGVADVRSK